MSSIFEAVGRALSSYELFAWLLGMGAMIAIAHVLIVGCDLNFVARFFAMGILIAIGMAIYHHYTDTIQNEQDFVIGGIGIGILLDILICVFFHEFFHDNRK